eukprot:scaffold1322_cov372-Pavlova_lutheri.AAC.22
MAEERRSCETHAFVDGWFYSFLAHSGCVFFQLLSSASSLALGRGSGTSLRVRLAFTSFLLLLRLRRPWFRRDLDRRIDIRLGGFSSSCRSGSSWAAWRTAPRLGWRRCAVRRETAAACACVLFSGCSWAASFPRLCGALVRVVFPAALSASFLSTLLDIPCANGTLCVPSSSPSPPRVWRSPPPPRLLVPSTDSTWACLFPSGWARGGRPACPTPDPWRPRCATASLVRPRSEGVPVSLDPSPIRTTGRSFHAPSARSLPSSPVPDPCACFGARAHVQDRGRALPAPIERGASKGGGSGSNPSQVSDRKGGRLPFPTRRKGGEGGKGGKGEDRRK